MRIAPAILGKHLHDAAIEQLSADLSNEGYDVQREARIGGAQTRHHADLIARRGNDVIVYEVKVLGDRSSANLARVAQAARDIGAQFRLVVVRPQRQVGIEIEGVSELVLKALREMVPSPITQVAQQLGEGWRVTQITDVELDTISWRDENIEVSGSAIAKLDNSNQEQLALTIPVTFTLWLNPEWQFTRQPSIVMDTSDLDI